MLSHIKHWSGAFAIACLLFVSPVAHAQVQNPECTADFACTGTVDGLDLLFLLSEWGKRGSSADLNGDGTVDGLDLLELLSKWGTCVYEYPTVPSNTEAWQISLETIGGNGGLVPSQEIYDRVERDLDLIRKAIPELKDKTHFPAWVHNQIIASYPAAGENPNVNCLLTTYQGQVMNILFGHMHVIQFPSHVNMLAMAQKFADQPETNWAEQDGYIGGDKFWFATPGINGNWLWDIDDGWHDCFDGCDCHIYYKVRTNEAGQVAIMSVTQQGMPWCQWPN